MNQTLYNIKETISRESPNILTAFGVTGLFTTVILAVKVTPKAMDLIESERYRRKIGAEYMMEPLEIVKAAWKPYIPAIVVGGLTIACILGANSINLKRNAAIASLYSVAVEGLREYQTKVVQTIGEKKELKIRDDIAQDRLDNDPVKDEVVIFAGGDTLFFDVLTGRYFKSDMESVRRAQNDFNFELMHEMYKPINDFYDLINLEGTEMGRNIGWNVDNGQLELRFSTKIATNDEPCIVLNYTVEPKHL